jgi:hypothetical protein
VQEPQQEEQGTGMDQSTSKGLSKEELVDRMDLNKYQHGNDSEKAHVLKVLSEVICVSQVSFMEQKIKYSVQEPQQEEQGTGMDQSTSKGLSKEELYFLFFVCFLHKLGCSGLCGVI